MVMILKDKLINLVNLVKDSRIAIEAGKQGKKANGRREPIYRHQMICFHRRFALAGALLEIRAATLAFAASLSVSTVVFTVELGYVVKVEGAFRFELRQAGLTPTLGFWMELPLRGLAVVQQLRTWFVGMICYVESYMEALMGMLCALYESKKR
ncbi:hypothetical protein HDV57DRAFT_151153 [Trichoderma longibrachiatum]